MEAAMSVSAISSAVYHLPAQRTIPRVEFTRVADLPPEEQDAIKARRAEAKDIGARVSQVNVTRGRHIQAQRVADLPPEEQAKIRAHLAEVKARLAEHDRKMAEMERKHQELAKGYESNDYCAPYVQGLSREQALQQIHFASEVIQSGQEEKYTLWTSLDGKQTTSNFRQYVYWLQQHVKELEATPQSTLAQA
jgi:chromosome segregation ATPase